MLRKMEDVVDPLMALQLRRLGLPWAKIAKNYGFSRKSMYHFRVRNGLNEPLSKISDVHLFALITDLSEEHPTWGYVSIKGALLSQGILVSEKKIRKTLQTEDPEGVERRKRRRLKRRVYSVPGANYLWHIDGYHKLIMYGLVIHGGIDGFSHKIIFMELSTNNRANTVLADFQEGMERTGLPKRVRGDKGCENGQVAYLIVDIYEDDDRFLFGTSQHNQRIERLWRDTREKVVGKYKRIFEYLESIDMLAQNNILNIFLLQYAFFLRIQRDLDRFVETWNNHAMRTEKSRTPNQQWLLDMLRQGHTFHHDFSTSSIKDFRCTDFIIRHILQSSYLKNMPVDVLHEWVNMSIEILPDPLYDDGKFGVQNYLKLRNYFLNHVIS